MEEEKILVKKEKVSNESNNTRTKSKKKIIIIVILIILLIAGGVFAYFKLFNKEDPNYFNIYGATFKTDDGKKLNFYTDDNNSVISREVKDEYTNSSRFIVKDSYLSKYAEHSKITNPLGQPYYYVHSWANFDGKIIAIYEHVFNINYGLCAGNDITKDSQYPFEYYFLLDYNTGRVIQFNEEIYVITHTVYDEVYHQGTDLGTTYFAKKDKDSSRYKIYTTDFKYLGDSLSSPYNLTDDNGYVYAINNGIISKYDEKGNKKESLRDVKNIVDFAIFQNNCLALIYENNNLYLYDFSDESKVKLTINTDYNTKKIITDNFFFYYNDDDMLNNEVIIYGASNGAHTITGGLGNFAIYDYVTKTFKKTYNSDVYTNDKITVELEEYDKKTDENDNEIKYYYLYTNGKTLKVKSYPYYDKNSDVLIVSNDNNIYILNTKTKKVIGYYTSKKKLIVETDGSYDHMDWYEIFENSIYKHMNGKLVLVAHKDNGIIVNLPSETTKGVLVSDDKLYIAFNKKLVKYSNTGKILETLTYDEIYANESSLVGAILGNIVIRKGNDYYLFDIVESDLKLTKLEKTTLHSNENGTLYVYKTGERSFVLYDGVFSEIDLEPEKEDDNYAIYSYTGSMCGNNIFVDKKSSKIINASDNMDYLKTNNGYYFYDADCVTDWGSTYIYTSSWKKIGEAFVSSGEVDDNGNVYVLNNGYIELRNINGELIEKSKAYKEIGGGLAKDNILYVTIRENKKVYFISLNSKLEEISRIEINTTSFEMFFPYLELENGKIKISITNEDGYESLFAYDLSSKKIEKIETSD